MKIPFWKSKPKEKLHGEKDVTPPELSMEKDASQLLVYNGKWDTELQTSEKSALADQVAKLHNSTKPASGNANFSNVGEVSNFSTPYTEFLNNGMAAGVAATNLAWSIVTYIKEFFVNRFEYEGVNFDYLVLEEKLFLYGRVCIFSLGEKEHILPFEVIEYDISGQPKIIKPFIPGKDKVPKDIEIKEVNADEIPWFQNDMSGIWDSNPSYSPIMRHWYQIQKAVSLRTLIDNNAVLAAPRWVFNTRGMSELEVKSFYNQFVNGSLLLLADFDGIDIKSLEGLAKVEDGLIDLVDRTDTLWLNYQNTIDELLTFVGARVNAGNSDKKERMNNDEINVKNSTTKMALRTSEELRKQGVGRYNKCLNKNASVKCLEIEETVENDKYDNNKEHAKKGVENV